jgi:hypothetical protein
MASNPAKSVNAAAPAAPPLPNWPANERPAEAQVVWDSQGLTIVASNSSLSQILRDIATDTGAKVEGLNQDERVFGTYGPGPAREVISKLLEGSGYNVLMIGGNGSEAPRQIVLSSSGHAAPAPQPAQTTQSPPPSSGDNDADTDESDAQPEQPEQPQPLQPPVRSPFGAPRTPQQIMQQMQQQRANQQNNQ